ncbi:ketopantoate reductase family protein [Paenibacillus illinoisensis]|uniref:ketopantoate reductase family protein n=1 Tax=Paenibacillus illinoisensis TaxID=59845 RepID=UPI00301B66C9
MNNTNNTSVCIVGAGSVGILTGYHLSLAGVAVTYLVRPHREEQLARPQVLYSYDDHSLKTFSDYNIITDPIQLNETIYDFVVVTLDGASLRTEDGLKVVDEIGKNFKKTSTGVILLGVGIELRSWFLQRSGLADAQVTQGCTGAAIYEAQRITMPVHDGVKSDLLAKADYGYRHASEYHFMLDSGSPQVAKEFATLYNNTGFLKCGIMSVAELNVATTTIVPVLAWGLLDWIPISDIKPDNKYWNLGINAMHEIQRLSIYGSAGLTASEQMDAKGVLESFAQQEKDTLPLDLAAFNRYHHGGKVNSQDLVMLRDALSQGEAEGAEMTALRSLIELLSSR